MKLQYLGTAAAEGLPGMFCDCPTCRRAAALGGRNRRTRSQALVDGRLLLDLPCDTYYHFMTHSIDQMAIENCLITHVHDDHFYPNEFAHLNTEKYSHPVPGWTMTVWGSPAVEQRLAPYLEKNGTLLKFRLVEPFRPFAVDGYTVTALKAAHTTQDPYLYAIGDGARTLLYAHDTGEFLPETMDYLRQSGLHFDLVSLDCTQAADTQFFEFHHLCLPRDIAVREALLQSGCADAGTRFVLNHFSHNGPTACYDDFLPLAEAQGFAVSYDGMTIEV